MILSHSQRTLIMIYLEEDLPPFMKLDNMTQIKIQNSIHVHQSSIYHIILKYCAMHMTVVWSLSVYSVLSIFQTNHTHTAAAAVLP